MSLPNVEIIWDSVVEAIEGEEQVEQVKILNRKTGEKSDLKVDGIFIAVGIHPNTECFAGLVRRNQQVQADTGPGFYGQSLYGDWRLQSFSVYCGVG